MSEENIDNNSSKDLGMDLGDSVYETYYTEDKIRSAGVSAGKELGKMVSEIRQEMMEGKEVNFIETNVDDSENGDNVVDDSTNGGFLNTAVDTIDETDNTVDVDENSLFNNGVRTSVNTGKGNGISVDSSKSSKIQTIVGKGTKVVGVATKVSSVAHKGFMAGMRFGKNANKIINGEGSPVETGAEEIKTFSKFVGRNAIRKPATKLAKKINSKIVAKPIAKAVKKVSKVEAKLIAKLAKTSSKLINKLITIIIKVIAKIISLLIKLAVTCLPAFAAVLGVAVVVIVVLSIFGGGLDDDQFEKYSNYMQDVQTEFQEETQGYYEDGYKVDGAYNGVAYINWQGALSIMQAIQPSLDGSNSEINFLKAMEKDGLLYKIDKVTTSEYVQKEAVYDDDGNVVQEEVRTTTKYVVTVSSFDDYKNWVTNNPDEVQKFCDKEDISYSTDMNDTIFENAETLYASPDFDMLLKDAGVVFNGSITAGTIYDTGEHSGELAYPTSYRNISAGFPKYSDGTEHTGIDFPVPTGTPVCACADGEVVVVKELTYSYGKYVVIKHNINGTTLYTLYAHNSQLAVKVGDQVKQGQVIALSGSTGNSTGPHCHLSVLTSWTPQVYVQPLDYLS